MPLPIPDELEQLYCEARFLLVNVGARASSLRLRIAIYYGKTMQPEANAREIESTMSL